MDGLIIKEPYIDWILSGEKTIELRGFNTNKRGRIALIKSGSGLVVGTVEVTNTFEISNRRQYEQLRLKHCVGAEMKDIKYKSLWAWELKNPKALENPVKYPYKKGQQVWVKDALREVH